MNNIVKKLDRWERNLRSVAGYESDIIQQLEEMREFKDKEYLIRILKSEIIRPDEKADEIRKLKIFYMWFRVFSKSGGR